jgi:SAM-dependent methyltransferase
VIIDVVRTWHPVKPKCESPLSFVLSTVILVSRRSLEPYLFQICCRRLIVVSYIKLQGLVRRVLGHGGEIAIVRQMMTILHGVRHRRDPWMKTHPFDISYGTTTSGTLPPWLLRSGEFADAHITGYAGCQPSCLRQALSVIPGLELYTFVDFGCGKGRALIVASEAPFKRILGIELAAGLVRVARRNTCIIRGRHPERTPIEIVRGDATAIPLPEGNLVIFLYHPFGPELVSPMLSRLVGAVAGNERVIFLIYENPVYGKIIDATQKFTRWYCDNVPCSASETGFAPDDSESVVVWRIGATTPISPQEGANKPIVIVKPGVKAELGRG